MTVRFRSSISKAISPPQLKVGSFRRSLRLEMYNIHTTSLVVDNDASLKIGCRPNLKPFAQNFQLLSSIEGSRHRFANIIGIFRIELGWKAKRISIKHWTVDLPSLIRWDGESRV